jgi:hypothetical protein
MSEKSFMQLQCHPDASQEFQSFDADKGNNSIRG